jgi:hypothetical protein
MMRDSLESHHHGNNSMNGMALERAGHCKVLM